MNAATLLEQFATPLLTGGTPRLDLPLGGDAFDALVAEAPPEAPALATAITRGSRAIWAGSPPATIDTDALYTAAMLHDLLGVLHPIFVDSVVAGYLGRRIVGRLGARERRIADPLVALRRHVLAEAALRSFRLDEHVDLQVLGRISAHGAKVEYVRLPWRVEAVRSTTEQSARDAFTGAHWEILDRLSPLTTFTIAAQEGKALPWIRWLTAARPLLRYVIHTLCDHRTGPDALMATLDRIDARRAEDARWWLGLTLLVGERTAHGPVDFKVLVDALRPYGPQLGAPFARASRHPPHDRCRTTRVALRAARLES